MTILPKLNDKNVNYVLETVEAVADRTRDRRAGSKGEEQARHILLNELMKFCDETNEQSFITHPGAGTVLHKILSICLIVSVVMNISLLAVFKYSDFIIDTVNAIFNLEILNPVVRFNRAINSIFDLGLNEERVDLPIGISFFTV